MKQPALNGAILGMETVLEATAKGFPAIGYRWKLYREGKLVQSGRIGPDGIAGNLKVELPDRVISSYRICVFEPPKRK